MDVKYKDMLDKAKRTYYKKEISKLKKSYPSKWYYWLKRLVSADQLKSQEVSVESLNYLNVEEQAEKLADEMSEVRNKFEPLNTNDIMNPFF